jgi:hypothetical protein
LCGARRRRPLKAKEFIYPVGFVIAAHDLAREGRIEIARCRHPAALHVYPKA